MPETAGHSPRSSNWRARARKDGTVAEREDAEHAGYGDWRSVEIVIKGAAKHAAHQAGADISAASVSAASVSAQIQQARFDRFLCRAFAAGERSEWLPIRRASSPASLPPPESQYHGEPCATAESGAPMKPWQPFPANCRWRYGVSRSDSRAWVVAG